MTRAEDALVEAIRAVIDEMRAEAIAIVGDPEYRRIFNARVFAAEEALIRGLAATRKGTGE